VRTSLPETLRHCILRAACVIIAGLAPPSRAPSLFCCRVRRAERRRDETALDRCWRLYVPPPRPPAARYTRQRRYRTVTEYHYGRPSAKSSGRSGATDCILGVGRLVLQHARGGGRLRAGRQHSQQPVVALVCIHLCRITWRILQGFYATHGWRKAGITETPVLPHARGRFLYVLSGRGGRSLATIMWLSRGHEHYCISRAKGRCGRRKDERRGGALTFAGGVPALSFLLGWWWCSFQQSCGTTVLRSPPDFRWSTNVRLLSCLLFAFTISFLFGVALLHSCLQYSRGT